MPDSEPVDVAKATREGQRRGFFYERGAIEDYANHFRREWTVFHAGTSIPDALAAIANGDAVDPVRIREEKMAWARRAIAERGSAGGEAGGISRHIGMDGLCVASKAWEGGEEEVAESLRILEAKSTQPTINSLGTHILRYRYLP